MFYYSTQRPITPGSLPSHIDCVSIENFPEKRYCPEIEGEAWGRVEIERPLSGYEAMLSELVVSGSKHFFGVKYVRYAKPDATACRLVVRGNGEVQMREMSAYGMTMPSNKIEIRLKPESKNIYDVWFASEQERSEFVQSLIQEAKSYEIQH